MNAQEKKFGRMGFTVKTSWINGLTILVFLTLTGALFLYMESDLVDLALREYVRSADQLIVEREAEKRMQAFTEICSDISSVPLFNFDPDSLKISLTAYLKMPSIKAIRVLSNEKADVIAAPSNSAPSPST